MGIKRELHKHFPARTAKLTLLTLSELTQVIQDNCPDAIQTGEIKNQFGRKVAIVSPVPIQVVLAHYTTC